MPSLLRLCGAEGGSSDNNGSSNGGSILSSEAGTSGSAEPRPPPLQDPELAVSAFRLVLTLTRESGLRPTLGQLGFLQLLWRGIHGPAAEEAAGEAAGGRAVTGEAAGGRAVTGEAAGGRAVAGEAAGGRAVTGEAAGGRAVAGEAAGGRAVAGEAAGGRAVAGEAAGGRAVAGEATGRQSGTAEGSAQTRDVAGRSSDVQDVPTSGSDAGSSERRAGEEARLQPKTDRPTMAGSETGESDTVSVASVTGAVGRSQLVRRSTYRSPRIPSVASSILPLCGASNLCGDH